MCAIVNNIATPDDSPEAASFEYLEHLAYQGILQDDDGHQLKYRDLVRGPDAASWLEHASQEWDRLIKGTATPHFVPASTKPKDKHAAYVKHVCTENIKPPDRTPVKQEGPHHRGRR
jgi:hypothetical protein